MRGIIVGLALAIAGPGCSLLPGSKQDPFPVLEIQATRPPPGPDKVVLLPSSIVIQDKVQFETAKADVKEVSYKLLDEVAKVMVDNPQIELVQIEGHTDSTGSADFNRKLSDQRAQAVMKYLVSTRKIKAARLVAKGFGPDRPVADNADAAGQEANRRVEFNIVQQGPKKTLVKDQ
jgi:OOP family OmpA-OmpF porin